MLSIEQHVVGIADIRVMRKYTSCASKKIEAMPNGQKKMEIISMVLEGTKYICAYMGANNNR